MMVGGSRERDSSARGMIHPGHNKGFVDSHVLLRIHTPYRSNSLLCPRLRVLSRGGVATKGSGHRPTVKSLAAGGRSALARRLAKGGGCRWGSLR